MGDLGFAAEEDTVAVNVDHPLPVSVHIQSVQIRLLPVATRADANCDLLDRVVGHEVTRADPSWQTGSVESAVESTELGNSLLDGGFHLLPYRDINSESERFDAVQLGDLGCCLLDGSLAEIHKADVGPTLGQKVW